MLFVVYVTRRSRGLFFPATETLEAESGEVLCYPEDGRLTFEVWVVVVKE